MSYGRGGAGLAADPVAPSGGSLGHKLRFSLGLVPAVWQGPGLRRKMALSMLCMLSQIAVGAGHVRSLLRQPDGLH